MNIETVIEWLMDDGLAVVAFTWLMVTLCHIAVWERTWRCGLALVWPIYWPLWLATWPARALWRWVKGRRVVNEFDARPKAYLLAPDKDGIAYGLCVVGKTGEELTINAKSFVVQRGGGEIVLRAVFADRSLSANSEYTPDRQYQGDQVTALAREVRELRERVGKLEKPAPETHPCVPDGYVKMEETTDRSGPIEDTFGRKTILVSTHTRYMQTPLLAFGRW